MFNLFTKNKFFTINQLKMFSNCRFLLGTPLRLVDMKFIQQIKPKKEWQLEIRFSVVFCYRAACSTVFCWCATSSTRPKSCITRCQIWSSWDNKPFAAIFFIFFKQENCSCLRWCCKMHHCQRPCLKLPFSWSQWFFISKPQICNKIRISEYPSYLILFLAFEPHFG